MGQLNGLAPLSLYTQATKSQAEDTEDGEENPVSWISPLRILAGDDNTASEMKNPASLSSFSTRTARTSDHPRHVLHEKH